MPTQQDQMTIKGIKLFECFISDHNSKYKGIIEEIVLKKDSESSFCLKTTRERFCRTKKKKKHSWWLCTQKIRVRKVFWRSLGEKYTLSC